MCQQPVAIYNKAENLKITGNYYVRNYVKFYITSVQSKISILWIARLRCYRAFTFAAKFKLHAEQVTRNN